MKRIISIILMALVMSLVSSAKVFKAPTKEVVAFTDTTTIHHYQIKDEQYPIYKTRKGRYYIWKVSKKTNKPYKYYIPKEVQQAIEECDEIANSKSNNKSNNK